MAKIMGKDQQFVRQAMIEGLLPIGVAFRKKGSSQYDFYISPKLLYDFTGFFFDDDLMDEVGDVVTRQKRWKLMASIVNDNYII